MTDGGHGCGEVTNGVDGCGEVTDGGEVTDLFFWHIKRRLF